MILIAVDFTKNDMTYPDEHTIACSIRDYLLSKYVDEDRNYEFARRELGKPYILDSEISFSLSHTNGCIACAFCVKGVIKDVKPLPELVTDSGVYFFPSPFPCEIGLDIELCDSARTAERIKSIASRYFTDGELERFERSDDRFTEFYQIWTRKESYVKCTGDGMKKIRSADTSKLDGKTFIYEIPMENNSQKYTASVCIMNK